MENIRKDLELDSLSVEELEQRLRKSYDLKRALEKSFINSIDFLQDIFKKIENESPSEVFNGVENYNKESFIAGFYSAMKVLMRDFKEKIDTIIEIMVAIKTEMEKRGFDFEKIISDAQA